MLSSLLFPFFLFFFFNDTATTEIYTLSLHDALPILMLVVTLASSVRLLNSFVAPANAANVNVPLAAFRIVTVLVRATQDPEVDWFVHVPFTVHVDAPRSTIVPAVRILRSPVTVTVEFRARNVP